MNFFENIKKDINTQKQAEATQKAAEDEAARKKNISMAKKQSMVNSLILAKTPTGGK